MTENNKGTNQEENHKQLDKTSVEKELRDLSSDEDIAGGFPWTVIPISIAFCPTGKCTKACK